MFLAMPVMLLLVTIFFGLMYQGLRDETEWDRMEIVSFETAQNGSYVKIMGRINSTEDVVIRKYEENEKNRWHYWDFDLMYLNESIFVNMSRVDSIEFEDSKNEYRNGDVVFVVGTIGVCREDNDTRWIMADVVVYDTDVMDDFFENMKVAMLTVGSIMVFVLCWMAYMSNPFTFRKPLINEGFPKVAAPPRRVPEESRITEEQQRIFQPLRIPLLVCGTIYLITVLVLAVVNLYIFNFIPWLELESPDSFDFETTLGILFMLGLINIVFLGAIVHVYPRVVPRFSVANSGLFYAFGLSELEFVPWEDVDHVSKGFFVQRLHLKDNDDIPIILWNRVLKREMISRIPVIAED